MHVALGIKTQSLAWPARTGHSNTSKVRHALVLTLLIKLSIQNNMHTAYLVSIAFPSTGHPDPIRGYVIHDSADRDTNKMLIDQ